MLATVFVSAALAGSISTGTFGTQNSINAPQVQQNPLIHQIGYRESGKQRLRRLLRSHFLPLNVTKAARAATGDPNITVIDRRFSYDEPYSCSFLTQQGKRVMICD